MNDYQVVGVGIFKATLYRGGMGGDPGGRANFITVNVSRALRQNRANSSGKDCSMNAHLSTYISCSSSSISWSVLYKKCH